MITDDRNTDERLISRLHHDDLGSLETLFARHSRAIHGFFFRTTGSAASAEDLTQDVFLRILRYHSSFRPGASFRVWMYGIARNVLSDHRARRAPEAALEDLEHEPASATAPPTEQLERLESRALVRRALARLDGAERELLVLSRFHELRHAELADLFQCTKGAIKVRVHRALKRLAVEIEALGTEVSR